MQRASRPREFRPVWAGLILGGGRGIPEHAGLPSERWSRQANAGVRTSAYREDETPPGGASAATRLKRAPRRIHGTIFGGPSDPRAFQRRRVYPLPLPRSPLDASTRFCGNGCASKRFHGNVGVVGRGMGLRPNA